MREMVQLMEPISPVYGAVAINQRRHYERWKDPLDGFIALGDSVCRLNPLAAQGMTVAAVSASILHELLGQGGPANPELPRRFFAAQARFQSNPFRIAAGRRLALPVHRRRTHDVDQAFQPLHGCAQHGSLKPRREAQAQRGDATDQAGVVAARTARHDPDRMGRRADGRAEGDQ